MTLLTLRNSKLSHQNSQSSGVRFLLRAKSSKLQRAVRARFPASTRTLESWRSGRQSSRMPTCRRTCSRTRSTAHRRRLRSTTSRRCGPHLVVRSGARRPAPPPLSLNPALRGVRAFVCAHRPSSADGRARAAAIISSPSLCFPCVRNVCGSCARCERATVVASDRPRPSPKLLVPPPPVVCVPHPSTTVAAAPRETGCEE